MYKKEQDMFKTSGKQTKQLNYKQPVIKMLIACIFFLSQKYAENMATTENLYTQRFACKMTNHFLTKANTNNTKEDNHPTYKRPLSKFLVVGTLHIPGQCNTNTQAYHLTTSIPLTYLVDQKADKH